MKWLVYQRGTIPLHRVAMVLLGVHKYAEKIYNNFSETLYVNQGPELLWSWNKKHISQLGKMIFEKLSNKKSANKRINYFKKNNSIALNQAEKTINLNLKNLSNQQLLEQYQKVTQSSIIAQGSTILEIDAFDVVSEHFFKKQFSQELMTCYSRCIKH